jgi:hypothetical protein
MKKRNPKQPEFPPGHVPQTPAEAEAMGKDWTGIVETPPKVSRNRPGINQQPGPQVPKPGMRSNRWTR